MSWLLERLRQRKDDRGLMANLRCALVESKKHRAWPALSRLGVNIDDEIKTFVAGLFARHPDESPKGNFGTTCKSIEFRRGDKHTADNNLTPTERRFQSLLVAERGAELHGRVLRMVLMAESEGIAINYEQLENDLNYWNERTRTEWARAFWTPNAEPAVDEVSP